MRKLAHIVGAAGELEKYMVQPALDRGYEVVGVCRASCGVPKTCRECAQGSGYQV